MTTSGFTQQKSPVDQHEWLLKRNCSLSPRQLAFAYALLCLASFSVALAFALHGAWVVLAFSILEMAAVALAFLHYARHATDLEHIALTDGCLLVERVEAGRIRQSARLDPHWIRIALPKRTQDLINLEAGGVRIEVGRYVTVAKRREVAQELRRELLRDSLMWQ
ncbi:MAG: hypothetical protein A3I66_09340 [Burkholderiales bacterium RIFCSPLOWO2_02_FULL_57_36]|nr:MAG: hypothetical protein A3I66_09340 [Burkholderiales bacterium RIFCSPLOWO2_02_FULL_57_36]